MTPKELRSRIIIFISENQGTDSKTLATNIGVTETEVKLQLNILEYMMSFSKTHTTTFEDRLYENIYLNPYGDRAVEDIGSGRDIITSIWGVWKNYDSKIDNVVQNLGKNVTINQANDSATLNAIFQVMDSMVEYVLASQDIPNEIKRDYSIEAQSFKKELRKSRINLNRVQEMLAFLGDVEGTLGLGGWGLKFKFVELLHQIEKLVSLATR